MLIFTTQINIYIIASALAPQNPGGPREGLKWELDIEIILFPWINYLDLLVDCQALIY
jgi:hypothetical protein